MISEFRLAGQLGKLKGRVKIYGVEFPSASRYGDRPIIVCQSALPQVDQIIGTRLFDLKR